MKYLVVMYIDPVQAAPAPPSFPLSSVWQGSKRSREEQEEVHKSSEEQEEQEEALSLSQAESSTSPVRQIKNTNSDGHTSPPKKQVSSRNALFGSPGAGEEELELAARKQELELAAGTQEDLSMALALSKVGEDTTLSISFGKHLVMWNPWSLSSN